MPPALKRAWRDELELRLVESYGQRELGGFMALGTPDLVHDDRAFLPVGRPLPNKKLRIFGPNDEPLLPGRVGKVVLRVGFMWGYWGQPEKRAETLRDGWLRSGDLGSMDTSGRMTTRGRKAALVTLGGTVWFPREVDEVLMAAPASARRRWSACPTRRPVVPVDQHGPHRPVRVDAAINAGMVERAVEPMPTDLPVLVMPMMPVGKSNEHHAFLGSRTIVEGRTRDGVPRHGVTSPPPP